jgi:integrase/recombinase XerD
MATSDTAQHIARFLRCKKSPATKSLYNYVLTRVDMWLRNRELEIGAMTPALAEAWTGTLRGVSKNSQRVYWTIAKTFCGWLVAAGVLERNPFSTCPAPATEAPQDRSLTASQVKRLLGAAEEEGGAVEVIVHLLYNSGCRASEVAGLRLDEVKREGDQRRISVLGKGSRRRSVLLGVSMSAMLGQWTRVQERRGYNYVFPSSTNTTQAITRHTVWSRVKRAAKRAGLEKVSPHWLRHAHVSISVEKGCPLHVVAATVGHRSTATTQAVYLHQAPGASSSNYLA